MTAIRSLRAFLLLSLAVLGLAPGAGAQELNLRLPTSNDALLQGDGPAFYMYTDRYFQGIRSRPWQGGQYGFVRDEVETPAGIVFSRFHEGVDIRPVYRNAVGEPLDTVRAVDRGEVVYVNRAPGRSSYGKYVVVEHWWSGAPFYSLYAHLSEVHVAEGQSVHRGDRLGRMGYTGRGLNRRRAHLHFEINVLLNRRFQDWHNAHYRSQNRHDAYNGLNLAGLDVAALYLALRNDPSLTIDRFLTEQDAFFSVAVPNTGVPDLLVRYPWLADRYDPEAPMLDIAFTQSGLPIRVRPIYWELSGPAVSMAAPAAAAYDHITYMLSGSTDEASLSRKGKRYLELLTLAPHTEMPPALAQRRMPRLQPATAEAEVLPEEESQEGEEASPVQPVRSW